MGLLIFIGKIILTVLNTVFAMVAMVMVILGCFVYYGGDFLMAYINPMLQQLRTHGYPEASLTVEGFDVYALFRQVAYPMIICGVILFIISFLGCCGANCENRILLILYAAVLGGILLAELLAITILAGGQNQFKQIAIDETNKYIKSEYRGDNSSDAFSVVFNVMMMGLKCCSITNYTELISAEKWQRNNATYHLSDVPGDAPGPLIVPFACCKMRKPFPAIAPIDLNCGAAPTVQNSYIDRGCLERMLTLFIQYEKWAIVGATAYLGVQACIIAIAVIIICNMGKGNPII